MSSNELETMSHDHAISGENTIVVKNQDQDNSLAPNCTSNEQAELHDIITVIPDGEQAKSVRVSAGKRRKVIPENRSTPALGLRARNTIAKPPLVNSKKPRAVKQETFEGIKEATRSALKKRLQETFEIHDGKVRELFHLTKFVSLVDYDANAAKEDESEVFLEVGSVHTMRLIVVQRTLRFMAESSRCKDWGESAVY